MALQQPDFGLTSIAALPPMVALWRERSLMLLQALPDSDECEVFGGPAAKAWGRRSEASLGGNHLCEGMTQESLQHLSKQQDSTQWWDNNRNEDNSRHPDVVRHNKVKEGLLVSNSAVAACRKLCEDGRISEAVYALSLMVRQGCQIPNNLFYRVLKRCVERKDLALGRSVHALIVTGGYESDAFLGNHLICMYASHGSLVEAMQVFSKVSVPDVYMWASIILAYARHGQPSQAIRLYHLMREARVKPDNRIFVAVLKACAGTGDLALGEDIHALIRASTSKPDIFVQTCLVDMYAKCGSLKDAQRVFDRVPQKNVVTWNAMIAGYAQQGMGQEALSLYRNMQQEGIIHPSSVTFVCVLHACASVGIAALKQGKQLHGQIEERRLQGDVVVGNSLVNMYVKCGSLTDAQRVFERLGRKDVVTWTAMIAGYAQQGLGQEALDLYSSMQQEGITPPDSVTFVCLLQACSSLGVAALQQGKQLHVQIEERGVQVDLVVGNSLVNMYAKCGSLEDARRVFDGLHHRDVVTWTAIIAGYAQQGMGREALTVYNAMQRECITPPDSVTFACLLQACASVAALPLGKHLHAQIEGRGLQADVVVGPSLVNMYAKCGSLECAQQVFDSLPERDIVAWGALIAGYARQGDSEVVFDLVDRMTREGVQPKGITFLSVLTACSHVGLVEKGRKFFEAMTKDYGITPTIEHFTCMMDLLGRAGHLDEALQMVKTMPFQPDAAVWLSLLGSCLKWNDVKTGQQVFEFAVRLDEKDPAAYILMSNIYAGAQMWEEATEMQARRKKVGAWKQPGKSWWTDMDGVMHSFVVGDRTQLESEDAISQGKG